jgi:hypothetical protein
MSMSTPLIRALILLPLLQGYALASDNFGCAPFPPPPPDHYGRYPGGATPVSRGAPNPRGDVAPGQTARFCSLLPSQSSIVEMRCFTTIHVGRAPDPAWRCPLDESCSGQGTFNQIQRKNTADPKKDELCISYQNQGSVVQNAGFHYSLDTDPPRQRLKGTGRGAK